MHLEFCLSLNETRGQVWLISRMALRFVLSEFLLIILIMVLLHNSCFLTYVISISFFNINSFGI